MKTLNDFNMKSKKPWEVEGVEWREVKLGDKKIAEIIMGQSPPSSSYNKNGEGIPFLQGNKEFGNIHPQNVMFTTDPKKIAQRGDVLLSVRAPVGDVNIADKEYCIGRGLAAIRFKGEPKYLFYLFFAIKKDLEEMGDRGTTFDAITKNHLKNLKIPMPFRNGEPDLETQKKIVEYIEANFSRIDRILEKKKKELELLDELWESVLEQAFKPKEGEEWREVRLGDKRIAEIIMGQSPPSSSYNKEGKGIPFLQGNKEFGKFHPKHVMFTSDPKKKAQKGDILLSVRAPVGDVNIANQEYCIGRGLAAIRFNGEPKYLFYLFVLIKEQLEELGKRGTTFKAITKNHLKTLEIPIPFRNGKPDLEKQKEIANYLDSVYEKIKTLKEKIQNQITQFEEMKESILDEVFNHDEAG